MKLIDLYEDAIADLEAVLKKHPDAFGQSGTKGYIEDAISDLKYSITKEEEQAEFDGILKVWSGYPTIWNKAQLGVK